MVVDVLMGSASDDDPGDDGTGSRGDGRGGSRGDSRDVGRESNPECRAFEEVIREHARAEARTAHAAAEFTASQAWVPSGARTPKAWMKFCCHVSSSEAHRHLSRGLALLHLPLVDVAFSAGAITGDLVDLLVALDHGVTKEALHRQEQLLVDLARTCTFDEFKAMLRYWAQRYDPDGTTEAAEEQRNQRKAWLVETFNGTWLGGMTLDPISGTVVAHELDRLEQVLFDADRAEAAERLGRDPLHHELIRTTAQRKADALLLMALRSKSTPRGAQKPEPAVHIHVGWGDLQRALSELEDGPVVPVSQLLPWMAGADAIRVTHDAEGGVTLSHAMHIKEVALTCFEQMLEAARDRKECDPAYRVFSGATRRAIEIRDGQCCHPFCNRPAEHCQVDHVIPYSQGGPTIQENGRLLCAWHNRWYYEHEQRLRRTRQDQSDTRDRRPPEADPPKRE